MVRGEQMIIKQDNTGYHYFDIHGKEIHEGDIVLMGKEHEEVFLTTEGELGTDSTNPLWIKRGWAAPGEFGIYPFNESDEVEIITEKG